MLEFEGLVTHISYKRSFKIFVRTGWSELEIERALNRF